MDTDRRRFVCTGRHWRDLSHHARQRRAEVSALRISARSGDGITDDTAAIQRAVSALLAAGGGRLYVPGSTGDYICNGGIIIDATLATGKRYGGAIQIVGKGQTSSCIGALRLPSR